MVGTRALTWGLTLPLAGAGVLFGHELTYRLVGDRAASGFHGYLAHAPQLVAILLTIGLLGLAVEQRTLRVGSNRFLLLGAAVFVTQEHVERLVHTGSLPFLLTNRAFLLGLAHPAPDRSRLSCGRAGRDPRRSTLRAFDASTLRRASGSSSVSARPRHAPAAHPSWCVDGARRALSASDVHAAPAATKIERRLK